MNIFKPTFSIKPYVVTLGFCILFIIVYRHPSVCSFRPLIIFFFLCYLFILIIYPTMHYKLKEKEMLFICGPFISRIKYHEIKKISNLKNFKCLGVGVGIPGYYLGYCFSREAPIIVYATSLTDIIMIETAKRRYVISPKNKDIFLEFLKEKITLTELKIG